MSRFFLGNCQGYAPIQLKTFSGRAKFDLEQEKADEPSDDPADEDEEDEDEDGSDSRDEDGKRKRRWMESTEEEEEDEYVNSSSEAHDSDRNSVDTGALERRRERTYMGDEGCSLMEVDSVCDDDCDDDITGASQRCMLDDLIGALINQRRGMIASTGVRGFDAAAAAPQQGSMHARAMAETGAAEAFASGLEAVFQSEAENWVACASEEAQSVMMLPPPDLVAMVASSNKAALSLCVLNMTQEVEYFAMAQVRG